MMERIDWARAAEEDWAEFSKTWRRRVSLSVSRFRAAFSMRSSSSDLLVVYGE